MENSKRKVKKMKKLQFIDKKERQKLNNEIINFFKKENDVEIGFIFADELIDLFLETSAKQIYNQGIEDAKKLIQEKMDYLETDIDSIKK